MIGPIVEEAPVMPYGEVYIVSMVLHGPDFDVPEAAGIRYGRAGHAGEDD